MVVTFNIPQGSNPGAGLVYTRDVGGGDGAVATKVVWVVVRGGDDSCGWKAHVAFNSPCGGDRGPPVVAVRHVVCVLPPSDPLGVICARLYV